MLEQAKQAAAAGALARQQLEAARAQNEAIRQQVEEARRLADQIEADHKVAQLRAAQHAAQLQAAQAAAAAQAQAIADAQMVPIKCEAASCKRHRNDVSAGHIRLHGRPQFNCKSYFCHKHHEPRVKGE